MFYYQFDCADEETVREEIERIDAGDIPTGHGFWGNALYRKGLHFTEYGKRISGFCTKESESEELRQYQQRIYFRGRFQDGPERKTFKAWVFPSPFELAILFAIIAYFTVRGGWPGFAVCLIVLALVAWRYTKLIDNTLAELRFLFR